MKRTIIKYMIFNFMSQPYMHANHPLVLAIQTFFLFLLYQYPLIDHPEPILFCFENSFLLSNIQVYAFPPVAT